jgi:hypothetical protein
MFLLARVGYHNFSGAVFVARYNNNNYDCHVNDLQHAEFVTPAPGLCRCTFALGLCGFHPHPEEELKATPSWDSTHEAEANLELQNPAPNS